MPVGVRKLPASSTPLRRCDASRRSPSGSRRGCFDRCPKGRLAPPIQRQAPQLGCGPSPPSHLIDGTAPREGSVPAAVGRWPRRRGAADAEAVAWSPPTHPGIVLAAPPDLVHAEPGDLRLPGLKECSGSRSVVDGLPLGQRLARSIIIATSGDIRALQAGGGLAWRHHCWRSGRRDAQGRWSMHEEVLFWPSGRNSTSSPQVSTGRGRAPGASSRRWWSGLGHRRSRGGCRSRDSRTGSERA